MTNHENKSRTRVYKIYLPHDKLWVEVAETQYYAYYREIWAIRKRAQAHRQCMCPKNKHWLCDGDCLVCPFHAPGDNFSLDFTHENINGEEYSMLDNLADPSSGTEDIVTDKIVLDMLFQRLADIMPEARSIGKLRMEGLSDSEIADRIGVPRTTFLSRLKKAKGILQREYPDLF